MYLVNYARVFVQRAAGASHSLIFAHHPHVSELANVSWMYRLTFICYLLILIRFLGAVTLKKPLFDTSRRQTLDTSGLDLLCGAARDINVHFYIAVTWKRVCIQAIISSQRDGGRSPRGRIRGPQLCRLSSLLSTFVQIKRRFQTRSQRRPFISTNF